MRRCKKPGKGQAFREGARVRSLRAQDGGAAGVVIGASRKRGGGCYTVMFDGWYRVAVRSEDELAEVR